MVVPRPFSFSPPCDLSHDRDLPFRSIAFILCAEVLHFFLFVFVPFCWETARICDHGPGGSHGKDRGALSWSECEKKVAGIRWSR